MYYFVLFIVFIHFIFYIFLFFFLRLRGEDILVKLNVLKLLEEVIEKQFFFSFYAILRTSNFLKKYP